MIFSKSKEFHAAVAVLTTLLMTAIMLLAAPTSAQVNGGESGGQQNEGCLNPQNVETFDGTENRRTSPFEITGGTFRLSYETALTAQDGSGSLVINVLDEDGDIVDFVDEPDDNISSDSTNVLEGPGTFRLEIRARNVSYAIAVEDCSENGTRRSTVSGDQNSENSANQGESNDVIKDTIPNKPLPPTGGWAVYALGASSVLVSAGLLGLGFGISRRRRQG